MSSGFSADQTLRLSWLPRCAVITFLRLSGPAELELAACRQPLQRATKLVGVGGALWGSKTDLPVCPPAPLGLVSSRTRALEPGVWERGSLQ